jgi:hypothetical protein
MTELYASHDRSYEDIPKDELASRCEICRKPFIYGWGFGTDDFKKNDDPGAKQADGRWTHNVCFEGEE